MKTLLLPHLFKKIGWFLLLLACITILILLFDYDKIDLTINTYGYFGSSFAAGKPKIRLDHVELIPNLFSILFIMGGILVMFSKEMKEDEYINLIRLNALQYAVFVNYTLLILGILLIHSFEFLQVLFYHLFSIIIIYIVRFQFLIYQNSILKNEQ